MKIFSLCLLLALSCLTQSALTQSAWARDELATTAVTPGGETIPYILTAKDGAPSYAVILMPGGKGILNPRMVDGKLTFSFGGNFLIRSCELFADGHFVAASTDATSTPARILAIVQDLQRRYGAIAVYVVGTSRSTEATMALAGPLDGQVAGFVHTSSMNGISGFDPRKYRSRHLVVYHRRDACRVTNPSSSSASRASFGTEAIEIDGGKSTGDDCEAYAYHGYNGVEAETVAQIKAWIARGA
ncbi:MAG: hypothetical protein Q8L22_26960 [Reyranella sp.]|nr:hypothetical protein [Reyranella sp.]